MVNLFHIIIFITFVCSITLCLHRMCSESTIKCCVCVSAQDASRLSTEFRSPTESETPPVQTRRLHIKFSLLDMRTTQPVESSGRAVWSEKITLIPRFPFFLKFHIFISLQCKNLIFSNYLTPCIQPPSACAWSRCCEKNDLFIIKFHNSIHVLCITQIVGPSTWSWKCSLFVWCRYFFTHCSKK